TVEGRVAEAEARTDEARRLLAERIGEAERTAEARAEEAKAQTQTARRELAEQIEAAREQVHEVGQELHGRIGFVEKKAEEQTTSTAVELRNEIDASRRVGEESMVALSQKVEEMRERSRKGTALMKARLVTVEGMATALSSQLKAEEQVRHEAWSALRGEVEALRSANAAMHARLTELEKPRGFRKLWNWVFGRKGR